MLEIIAITLISIVFWKLLQEKIWFPSNIFYIIIGLLFAHFSPETISFSQQNFNYLVFITLPFLIASDSFALTWKNIKKNYISIIVLALVNVIFSVFAIVILWNFILPGISTLILVILASTISPTDPVWVNAALSNFKVPHKLAFKLESESLANDIVALSIFSIAIWIYVWDIHLWIWNISLEVVKLIGESLFIWLIIWFISLFFLNRTDDAYIETFIVLTWIFVSFLITDHYLHVSGIFAVIVVMLTINEKIKQLWREDKHKEVPLNIIHPENHDFVEKILYFIALLANAFLFIALGSLVDFFDINSFVWKYFEESFYIFIFLTITRWIFMYFYSHLSRKTKKIDNISSFRWWSVLTFWWMRWGLSILMIFILSLAIPDYKHLEELQAIVFNVVFLITFTYTPILIFIFKKYSKKFDCEYTYEIKHSK